MDSLDMIRIIERINADYLSALNSPEYKIGDLITRLKITIKTHNIKKIIGFWKLMSANRKLAKFPVVMQNKIFYFNEQPRWERGCVYTCITGGYDQPTSPMYVSDSYDFILYTDKLDTSKKYWREIDIKTVTTIEDNITANRYCKLNPFSLFENSNYEYSLYVDGNIQVVSDISSLYTCAKNSRTGIAMHKHKTRDCIFCEGTACIYTGKGNKFNIQRQLKRYKKEGFPEHFGMCEASIIMVDLKNKNAYKIMSEWWKEFLNSESGRDQLAFPYVLWKNGFTISDVGCLGNNLFFNPKFRNVDGGRHGK